MSIRAIIQFAGAFFVSSPTWATSVNSSSLDFSNTEYLSHQQPYFRDSAKPEQQSLFLRVFDERQFGRVHSSLQVSDEYSAAESWNYLDVHQMYASLQATPQSELTFGRRLYTWSEWEQPWRQGLFQSRYLENRLDPSPAGLVGPFVDGREGAFAWTFGVPFFVPDFGPHFDIENNQFVSANPWFHPPAAHFVYRDQTSDIHYSLVKPEAEQVVRQIGLATKLEMHDKNFLSRWSYAYQPMPQFLLGFPSRGHVHIQPDNMYMDVEIHAQSLYHHVYNWDQVLQAGRWRLALSLAHDVPDAAPQPEDWTTQTVTPAWIAAVQASVPIEEDGPQAARLMFGALKVWGGDGPDRGDFAGADTLFERRFQYQEAYLLELSKPFRHVLSYHPLETRWRLLYDRQQNGGSVGVRTGLALDQHWRGEISLDILGLLGGAPAVRDGFLSTYRANDRVAVGASYVF